MNNERLIAYSKHIIRNKQSIPDPPLISYLTIKINTSLLPQTIVVYAKDSLRVGRGKNNDIMIADVAISRQHIHIIYEEGSWFVIDQNSLNGCFINHQKVVGKQALNLPCDIHFGHSDIILSLSSVKRDNLSNTSFINNEFKSNDRTQIFTQANSKNHINNTKTANSDSIQDSLLTEGEFKRSVNAVKEPQENKTPPTQQIIDKNALEEKLFSKKVSEDAGEYTQIVRGMINKHRKKKSRVYQYSLFFLALILSATIAFVVYQQSILDNARTLALDMFYDIKEMEISLAKLELQLQDDLNESITENSENSQEGYAVKKAQQALREAQQADADKKRKKLQAMQEKYQTYLKKLESIKLSRIKAPLISARRSQSNDYEKQLILNVAIKFGESELELPDGFYDKVHEYIVYWQSSSRLPRAMRHLANKNYAPVIKDALRKQNLPEQFLYLVLQESNFNTQAIGLETRYGIAKGAWQFLPGTGKDFGLIPGEKAAVREYDRDDERFQFDKASYAGAKYLKHIYSTEAQASGLLVMAGYNYGHNRVKGMIRKMPNNPRERNFWKFIQKYKIPKETYDYVFYIFSAAVIAEDPTSFGFSFRSPTAKNKK